MSLSTIDQTTLDRAHYFLSIISLHLNELCDAHCLTLNHKIIDCALDVLDAEVQRRFDDSVVVWPDNSAIKDGVYDYVEPFHADSAYAREQADPLAE
jgi:hypothetical protein